MKNNLKEIEFIVDRVGQKIFVGDIVLYPKMSGRSPRLTIARVISIKERIGENAFGSKYSVRISAIQSDYTYSIKDEYPNAIAFLNTYEASLTQHADNLVKIKRSVLNQIEGAILLHDYVIVVERDIDSGSPREFKIVNIDDLAYTDEDLIRASNYDWRLTRLIKREVNNEINKSC